MRERLLERVFRVSLWAKAFNGALEVAGGTLLLVTSSASIHALVARITVHELRDESTHVLGSAVIALGQQLGQARVFASAYLLVHGVVKLVLAAFFLRGDLRAYPWGIAALALLTLYQVYMTLVGGSVGLLALTVLDVVIVALAVHEYRMLRAHAQPTPSRASTLVKITEVWAPTKPFGRSHRLHGQLQVLHRSQLLFQRAECVGEPLGFPFHDHSSLACR